MISRLLEKLKNIFTVKEWEEVAADALSSKNFVIEPFLTSLHRVQKADAGKTQERSRQPQARAPMAPATRTATQQRNQPTRSFADSSLAELMQAVREQQANA
jgi:hypothetical protein